MQLYDGAHTDESLRRTSRTGGWREAFLNRPNRGSGTDTAEDFSGSGEHRTRGATARSLSRHRDRAASRTPGADGAETSASEVFNQRAVLEQDRALIEQLMQRTDRRERSTVRKPPPPPKVTPYRGKASGNSNASVDTAPPSPSAAAASASPTPVPVSERATPVPPEGKEVAPMAAAASYEQASHALSALTTAVAQDCGAFQLTSEVSPAPVEPVVPRTGSLFTAADIDSIMNRLGPADGKAQDRGASRAAAPEPEQLTHNFGDISKEFFESHRMEVPQKEASKDKFEMTQRRAPKELNQAFDSWLEDDLTARDQFSAKPGSRTADQFSSLKNAVPSKSSGFAGLDRGSEDIFRRLEEVKRKKALGERVSPVTLKEISTQVKPVLPDMTLDQLVNALRLFCSARVEDNDLYLRILGEIPVQVRGISPEMLTTCLRVLWRLRLHEETYLELFSMEAMNMIRAARKPMTRAPRRPPAPSRVVDAEATKAASAGLVPPPSPPPVPAPPQAPAPFSAQLLIHIGNALSQLGAKHPVRFMDVYQEQLAIALPKLTQAECELVSPSLATSQLMPDALRRAFLDRCSQVDAGAALASSSTVAAPDITSYQREAELRRQREKNFRNIFLLEASIRKETFSFFTSLPAEVRTYLDRVHADAASLKHEGTGPVASQVAAVLDQLGVSCELMRMTGPLSLHVVAKATNPRAELKEVVYECSEIGAFCAARQDDRNAVPQLTTVAKLRHKLLQRLGFQLVHIHVWEWNQMSEAQRVNYMVKLQSTLQ